MTISEKELQSLLAEIERLKLENAILRRAAGIHLTPEPKNQTIQVSDAERQALFRKTV